MFDMFGRTGAPQKGALRGKMSDVSATFFGFCHCGSLFNNNNSLHQFLFANYQSISCRHFVAVHSRNVRCSRRSQKSIKTPYFESSGSFKVIDLDATKNSSLVVLVVIGCMPIW